MYLSATPAAPPLTSRSTLLPQLARPLISQSTFMPYVTGNLAPVDAQAETTVSHVVLLSATPAAPPLTSRSTLLPQLARPLISQSTFMPYVTGNLAPVDAQAETTVSPVVLFSDVELSATPTAPSLISRSTLLPQPARPLISQSTFVSYVTGNLAPIDAQAERPLSLCRVYTRVQHFFPPALPLILNQLRCRQRPLSLFCVYTRVQHFCRHFH